MSGRSRFPLSPRHRRAALLLAFAALGLDVHAGAAQAPAPAVRPVVLKAWPSRDSVETRVSMGHRIRIRTSGLVAARKTRRQDTLVLFLNGRPMHGVYAQTVGATGEVVEVRLRRGEKPEERGAWEPVAGRPSLAAKTVRVGLGFQNEPEFPRAARAKTVLELVLIRTGWLVLAVVLWVAALVALWGAARRGGLLRDSPPTAVPPGNALVSLAGKDQPYSLARTQMAFWFVLIGTAFVGIWLVTGDFRGVVTEQAVWLMGIGSLTALGGKLLESVKQDQQAQANTRAALADERARLQHAVSTVRVAAAPDDVEERNYRAALAETEARLATLDPSPAPVTPPRRRFWKDILYSGDSVALHRVQMVFWTLILGTVFVREVWRTLALPEFDAKLLALLGVSGGFYLFSKNTEPHT